MLAEKAGLNLYKVLYDSTHFQFSGSEKYINDIPLSFPRRKGLIHFLNIVERCMRAMLVVPREERSEFPAKVSLALWNHDPASRLVFHSPDEALDYSDAPVLPNGAEPWTNSLEPAPALEVATQEDGVLVADQVLRRRVVPSDDLSKESTHCD